jgi:hypothetical protein
MSSILHNSALVYEPKCGGGGGVAGPQPMRTAVHRSPNKLLRSNSIFNLCIQYSLPAIIRHANPICLETHDGNKRSGTYKLGMNLLK